MSRPPTDTDRTASTRRRFLVAASTVGAALTVTGTAAYAARPRDTVRTHQNLRVRIENVSEATTLATTAGDPQPVPLSPGVWAVHTRDEPVFSHGEYERFNGLEEVAEDGNPAVLAETLAARDTTVASGAFTTPVGADAPAPIGPGGAYEWTVSASRSGPSHYLSLVTMFVPSNDLFYALGGPGGMRLFEAGELATGDVTEHVSLWDAGTEINEEPGVGENQVQRQRASGVGLVERGTVAPITEVNGYDYPAVTDVIRVTIEAMDDEGEDS